MENLEEIGTAESVIFWSKTQLDILAQDSPRLLLDSAFGTGKSTLLKEKAKRLAERDNLSKVLVLVCHGGWDAATGVGGAEVEVKESFLYEKTKKDLAPFESVRVEYLHVSKVVDRMAEALMEDTHVLADEFRDPGTENREGIKRLTMLAQEKVG